MPAQNPVVYAAVLALIHKTLPKFRVVAKSTSRLHRFIAWALRFPWVFGWSINRIYMTGYWTTIGQTAAYPDGVVPTDSWNTILHEQQHSRQAKRLGPLFGPLYLLGTPVYGVVFGLIAALCTPLWIWVLPWYISLILVGLGLVLSIPVPFGRFRAAWEYEAYAFNLAVDHWTKGRVDQKTINRITNEFTSSRYSWMHPDKKAVVKRLNALDQRLIDGTVFEDKIIGQQCWDMYRLLDQHGLVVVKYNDLTSS